MDNVETQKQRRPQVEVRSRIYKSLSMKCLHVTLEAEDIAHNE